MKSYFSRKKSKDKFDYFDGETRITDKSTIERIHKLKIPPAWRDVRVAKNRTNKVQAEGFDGKGRKQAIYHPNFRLRQERLKFDRIMRFAVALPRLRQQINKDLARKQLNKDKVLATIVKLIDEYYFRVGNEQYAKENQTYGITTLRSKHTNISTNTINFDFVGKSGKEHHKTINDPKLARVIKQLDELPGYEIFRYQDSHGEMYDLHSSDVNEYIKKHMGSEFTAKDFRTWAGTMIATTELLRNETDSKTNSKERKRIITATVKSVAKKLGNTPAVARGSYIDPRVIQAYESDKRITEVKKAMQKMKPKKYLSLEEQCVLKLLKNSN